MSITPFSTPHELAQLAASNPELGAVIAWHPNAYDGLLDWLAEYGDEAARAAVRDRRARAGMASGAAAEPTAIAPPPTSPSAAGLPAEWQGLFRPAGQPAAASPVPPQAMPVGAPAAPAAAPRKLRAPAILGIGAGVIVLAVVAAFAIGPVWGLLTGNGSGGVGGGQGNAETFDLAGGPTFADGIGTAWKLSLDELQPDGEQRGFYGYADYGDFWLVSTYEFFGDLAHGGRATAVDAASGEVLWSLPDGASERACANRLIGGRLICAHGSAGDRTIESIDPKTGSVAVEPDPGFLVATLAALDDSYLVVGFDDWESSTFRLSRVRPGGQVQWKVELPARCTTSELYDQNRLAVQQADGYLVLNLNYCLGVILDPATGKVSDSFGASNLTAHPGGFSAELPYCLREYGTLSECSGTAARSVGEASLPDGGRLPVRYGSEQIYVWTGTDALLDPAPVPWYFAGQDDCYLDGIVDTVSGRTIWRSSESQRGFCPMQVGDGSSARPAFVMFDDRTDWLTLLDPGTGDPVWQRDTSAVLSRSRDTFGYFADSPDAQTIVLSDDHGLNAFASSDGRPVWQGFWAFGTDSWWRMVPGPNGASLVEENEDRIARLVPTAAPTRVAAMPAGIPDCPKGWTPVSWSTWEGGHTLVCSAGSQSTFYLEYVDGQTVHRSSAGTATPTGWSWTLEPGHEVAVSFSGGLVQVTADGNSTSRFPAAAWRDGVETGFSAPPSALPGCPAGAWPLSLSIWDGGWLLVCGTDSGQPSSLLMSEGSTVRETTTVSQDAGTYCGQLDDTTVCAYQVPALVSVRTAGGDVTQHSVTENWFAGAGHGGEGEGTGSYGVEAPDRTAADQLRYLDEILARSKAARKTLSPAINDVLACENVSSAIKRIDAVTANRDELLAALQSTPVDALPEGERIVVDLRHVLELSRATDQAYADWAREEKANGCTGGTSSRAWKLAKAADDAVDGPKNAFVTFWNTQIAPAYGVRELTNSDI